MSINDAIKLLDAITKLAGTLIWPGVLIFLFVHFDEAFRNFLDNLSEFSFKGAGFEASAKRNAEAAGAIAAASISHADPAANPAATAKDARAAAQVVARIVTPRLIRRAGQATVLWVDDQPDNNVHERQSLEALGVTFELAMSTDEAMQKISHARIDAIITDMNRPPDSLAGLTLIKKLREANNQTPVIVYAGASGMIRRDEAKERGALGVTNRPDDLFRMVLSALGATRNESP